MLLGFAVTLVPSENTTEPMANKSQPSYLPATKPSEHTPKLMPKKKYEDTQWLKAVIMNASTTNSLTHDIMNTWNLLEVIDRTEFENIEPEDMDLIEESAENLSNTSETSLKHSNRYKVSPELQPIKTEYDKGLTDIHTAAEFLNETVELHNNNDTEAFTDSIDFAESNMEYGSQHIKTATTMLEAYKQNQSIPNPEKTK